MIIGKIQYKIKKIKCQKKQIKKIKKNNVRQIVIKILLLITN